MQTLSGQTDGQIQWIEGTNKDKPTSIRISTKIA